MATDPAVTSSRTGAAAPIGTDQASRRTGTRVLTLLVGLLAALVGVAVVALLTRALGASTEFKPLTAQAYVFLATLGYLIGLAGWSFIRMKFARPASVLRRLVPVVLVLSFIPDLLVLAFHALPGTTVGGVIGLMVMHLVVAAAAIPAYRRALPVT